MLSIIVPILNEKEIISDVLQFYDKLISQFNDRIDVIYSDSGSSDGTLEVLKNGPKNKNTFYLYNQFKNPSIGQGIHQAMKSTLREYIIIIPCDVFLQIDGFGHLISKLESKKYLWGGFYKTYYPSNIFFNIFAFLQNHIRWKLLKNLVWTNAIFFKKNMISDDNFPIEGFLEDILLSDLLKKNKGRVIIKSKVEVSARRYFLESYFLRMLKNIFILFCYRTKMVSIYKLKKIYEK